MQTNGGTMKQLNEKQNLAVFSDTADINIRPPNDNRKNQEDKKFIITVCVLSAIIIGCGTYDATTLTARHYGNVTTIIRQEPAPSEQALKPSPSVSATTVAPPPATMTAPAAPVVPPATVTAPAAPASFDPWGSVNEYYTDLEARDYLLAWNQMMAPSFQAQNGSEASWAAGYATTSSMNITEISESGDTVYVNLTAVNNNGTQSFTGWYTVDTSTGLITGGSLSQA